MRSETVSNHTFSDSSSYHRFDPHKGEKKGIALLKDMENYLDDNFNKYISSQKVNDVILKTTPVPVYDALRFRAVDPLIYSILEDQGKYVNKNVDIVYLFMEQSLVYRGVEKNLFLLQKVFFIFLVKQ